MAEAGEKSVKHFSEVEPTEVGASLEVESEGMEVFWKYGAPAEELKTDM